MYKNGRYILVSTYKTPIDLEKAIPQLRIYEHSWNGVPLRKLEASPTGLFKSTKQLGYSPLPPKRSPRLLRHLRYTFFTVYQRLFSAVILLNFMPLVLAVRAASSSSVVDKLGFSATAASANLLLAILIRQDYVVNSIFRTAWLVHWRTPLKIRRWIARCYCYGGIHSSAAVVGTLWWTAFSGILLTTLWKEKAFTVPLVVIALTILGFLVVILITSTPAFRKRWHNCFELTHRFIGWASICLFWAQLVLLARYDSAIRATTTHRERSLDILVRTPTFWMLILITAMLIYPWISVRGWAFRAEVLSSHALRLHFNRSIHKMSFLSISTSPLREWHPFAVFPGDMRGETSSDYPSSMIVSDAGNWTRALIERAQTATQQLEHRDCNSPPAAIFSYPNRAPPRTLPTLTLYTRTNPRAGVLSLTTIFPRVVIVTTGSGIGPALSSLLDRPPAQRIRLIWSARAPHRTYGTAMLDLVHKADPDAVVIDTEGVERPDLVRVAWREAQMMEGGAEAVFVLGNEKVTRKVVYGLEARGMPAFGPVWDS